MAARVLTSCDYNFPKSVASRYELNLKTDETNEKHLIYINPSNQLHRPDINPIETSDVSMDLTVQDISLPNLDTSTDKSVITNTQKSHENDNSKMDLTVMSKLASAGHDKSLNIIHNDGSAHPREVIDNHLKLFNCAEHTLYSKTAESAINDRKSPDSITSEEHCTDTVTTHLWQALANSVGKFI